MDQAITTTLIILCATILLLVFEVVRIDIAALLCLLALGWSGVITPQEAFSGFSSSAVIAVIAVMILGHGIAKTGLMDRYSTLVLSKVGANRSKIILIVSLISGILSAFIQNVGAAALFLPGIKNIARQSKIPASTLVMPIGFATILGGAISMVGSGSLIVVNDLLRNAGMDPYGLFSVAPVGLVLLASGIVYFFIFGTKILPDRSDQTLLVSDQEKLIEVLNLPKQIWLFKIPAESSIIGKTTEQSGVWDRYNLHILGLTQGEELQYAPWRESNFQAGQELAILGDESAIIEFASHYNLIRQENDYRFAALNDPGQAGFAEVIIPHRSELVGQTIRQYGFRKRFAVEPVMLFSKGEEIRDDFSDHQIIPGDTFIVHGLWEHIGTLKTGTNFVVTTTFTGESKDRSKTMAAVLSFLGAIILAMAGASIALSFLTGAVALVLLRGITIQEAYQAVEWKVVFLLAGLIPLGVAMQKTGSAAYIADLFMLLFKDSHPFILLIAVAALASLLSLFISNVGSVVVLTPLVINIALISGLDPRPLVLLAAVSALNSFILPTHQVNALMMTAGGYRNSDYLKAGGGMTLIFIAVAVTMFYYFYI
jgi:di/tricarboxylate transporter